jgi:DNA-binding NarL/FixJ family response regulator
VSDDEESSSASESESESEFEPEPESDPEVVLDAALDSAAGGAGSVVLVSGESGTGKTSLVRAFARSLRGSVAATRTKPAGLTERQMEILRLLAAGMTNAEIAGRLAVSVRTVDHHVSAVLQKLGVAARREAAAAVATLGLG